MNANGVHLTPREQQVYDLMITGTSQRTAAKIIGISVRSVKFYTASIFKKLGVYSTRQVVATHYMGLGQVNGSGGPGVESLSKAERRVYDQVVTGVSRKEIASRVFRADTTVTFHLKNISKKLGVNSMLELIFLHYVGDSESLIEREAA